MQSMIDDIMNTLTSGNHIAAISKSVGGNETAVQSALGMSLPLVLSAMASHASQPGGSEMLAKTLAQTGSNNPLDNISGHISNPAAAGGPAMAGTLLGGQMGMIQNAIAQKTGLPPSAVSQVLAIAVPLIMGHVSRMSVQQNVDPKNLSGILADQSKAALQSSPEAAMIAQQLPALQGSSGGIPGIFKKILGS
jgi:hypothetical protein